jgi:hypothetical protein
MYHETRTVQRVALAAALCAIALLVAGAASAADTAARITAVAGATSVGDAAAEHAAHLGEDSSVQTADDGNCAMLVDEDALVELCSSTIMMLTRTDKGNRVVKVDGGTTRIVAEPRTAGEYIEIHTPAAIATIMGTTVFVEVDAVTGDTKITSDKPVEVRNIDPNVAGSAIASNMNQVTVLRGRGPSQPMQLEQRALANLGGCLVDFHQLALTVDRSASNERTQNRMAMGDGQTVVLPFVGAGPPPPDIPEDPPDPPPDIHPWQDWEPPDDERLPEPCGPIPGDGCQF